MEKKLRSQIDIVSIVRDILRNWFVVLLFALAVSLFANVIVNVRYTPTYVTKCTFAVTTKGTNASIYNNLSSAKELAGRFTQLLDSNVLKKRVAEDLGQTSFRAVTSAEQVEETNLVELRVSADSALESYRTMISIMENYDEVSDYVIGNVILEVIQQPSVPTAPTNSKNTKHVMLNSFAISALAVILVIGWLSSQRDTVKNEKQMRDKIDAHLLGVIYHERKNKKRSLRRKKNTAAILINNPNRSFAFVESNKLMASRVISRMERRHDKVIALTSATENEGKSTIAANLSLALAQQGKRVVLIDLDFRKPAQYKIFSVKTECDLCTEVQNGTSLNELVQRQTNTGLYTVFNTKNDGNSQQLLYSGRLKQMIDVFRSRMDIVILDTAPVSLVSDTEDQIEALADSTVLVVREDAVLAKDINDCIDRLNRDGHVLGAVFNNATHITVPGGIGQYGYGTGYGRYGGYGKYGGYYGKK